MYNQFTKIMTALIISAVIAYSAFSKPQTIVPKKIPNNKILLTIGQDLSAIRGYTNSHCCPAPTGVTAYIGLYSILNPKADYGGIGMDSKGNSIDLETNWGGGPTSALKIATENPNSHLSIGLSMTEDKNPNAMSDLLKGKYDQHIAQLAKLIQRVDRPVYLRIAYEFEGSWNQGYGNTDRYKAAYRYVVTKLRAKKVKNVTYVWQAASSPVDDLIDGGPNPIENWYPGDTYVDMIGTSWFLTLDEKPTVQTAAKVQTQRQKNKVMLDFARRHGKGVMIAESAPQGYDIKNLTNRNIGTILDGEAGKGIKKLTAEQIWQQWYDPFFSYIYANKDVIRHVAYINAHWDKDHLWGPPYNGGYWGDSRIQANEYIQKKWLQEITKPIWIKAKVK